MFCFFFQVRKLDLPQSSVHKSGLSHLTHAQSIGIICDSVILLELDRTRTLNNRIMTQWWNVLEHKEVGRIYLIHETLFTRII